jgi:hypothetical protein
MSISGVSIKPVSSAFSISASTVSSPVPLVNNFVALPLDGRGVIVIPKKMRQIERIFVFLMLTLIIMLLTGFRSAFSVEPNGKRIEMKKLFPQQVGPYKSDDKDEFYDRQTTFRYMDGAAELYRSFGFNLLMVRRYIKPDSPPIIAEFFDMGSSQDAFGIFTFETGGEEMGVGQGSDYGGGLLRFWQGKFFVNVYAEQETPSTKQDVLEIAKAIARSLGREGQKPKLIRYLPQEGLSERSIRYFHLHQSLNYHYFVSHQNILHLGEKTHAVLASYLLPQTKEKTFLLLIQYPSQKMAGEALQSFTKAYMPEASATKIIKTENGRWAAAQFHREYVIVVFEAPFKEKAEELIQAAKKKLGATQQ